MVAISMEAAKPVEATPKVRIYFTFDATPKEGFESKTPMAPLDPESVDEIESNAIDKVPSLVDFVEHCYRILRKGGTARFTAPYFASALAWQSPLTKRGISEASLNFASKDWRSAVGYNEYPVIANFEVVGNFAVEQTYVSRSDEAKAFWLKHFNNVAQTVIFTLTKKEP